MTDADLFEAFVRRYQDMVYATAVRLLGNPADAEDAAQTVFLKAFQRFAAVGTSPAAAGWLKTVTRNVCLNHLSRYRSRWRFFSELEGRDTGEGDESDAGLPASIASTRARDAGEAHEELERALRELPEHQRVPIVLYHFEEMSYQEIADAMGVSISKVKSDIHRGREALKQELLTTDGSR
jgi:RNA polymerase sigma-70 factor (ECF subfamily)